MTTFKLVLRQQPIMTLEVAKKKSSGNCLIAYKFVRSRQKILNEAHESSEKVARRMKMYANKGQKPLEFHIGDRVCLKLIPKYDKLFEVM